MTNQKINLAEGPITWKDPETGEKMKISYSQELQTKTAKELRIGNHLKILLIFMLAIVGIFLMLIYYKTGIIGIYLARAIC